MTSYLSSLLTSTTSKYNNLRRSLLNDESDGDTEDDTHICRVLRAYYIEKGRPFPQWLPPDPHTQPPAQYSQGLRQQTQSSSLRRGGGLSDLWDAPSQQGAAPQPQSLRRSEATAGMRNPPRPFLPSGSTERLGSSGGWSAPESRGSMSSQSGQPRSSSPALSSSSAGTAQDRLKARLGSKRGGSAQGQSDYQSQYDRQGGYR